MSSFAERLVTRGARVASIPGFTMLNLRPLSRFEAAFAPTGANGNGPEGEAVVHAGPPASSAASIAPASLEQSAIQPRNLRMAGEDHAPLTSQTVRRSSEPAERNFEQSERRVAEPRYRPQNLADLQVPAHIFEAAAPPRVATESSQPSAAVALSEKAAFSTSRETARPLDTPSLVTATPQSRPDFDPVDHFAPNEHPPPTLTDIGGPLAHPPVGVAEANLVRPLTVTVGRIEVQFVQPPQQRPVAIAPQTERSRGFATYARARRGEPR